LRVDERGLRLEVRDDGRGPTPPVSAGNGISGMHERVRVYGGNFSAAATSAGFVVAASFPLGALSLEQPV
jgi:signal transduction histidine kinase